MNDTLVVCENVILVLVVEIPTFDAIVAFVIFAAQSTVTPSRVSHCVEETVSVVMSYGHVSVVPGEIVTLFRAKSAPAGISKKEPPTYKSPSPSSVTRLRV
jgi:hypothetical protein